VYLRLPGAQIEAKNGDFKAQMRLKLRQLRTKGAVSDTVMKPCIPRFILISSLGILFTGAAVAQQSLGEVARQVRKNKPAEPTTKVITNDELRSSGGLALPDDVAAPAAASDQEAKPDADKEKPKASLSADDQGKLDKEWQDKISAQKNQIALLERELDVLQRESKLRVSNYYADAGTRLRNQKQYAEDDRKYQNDIAAKQKAIEDAKATLEQMRDEARKAGAGGIG
jgi:hypothetical protein